MGFTADYVNYIDFLFTISKKFEKITLYLLVKEQEQGSVKLTVPENVRIVHLPYYMGSKDLVKKAYKIIPALFLHAISKKIARYDVVGVVAPGTISTIVAPITYYYHSKPLFLITRGFKYRSIQFGESNWVFRQFAKAIVSLYDIVTRKMLKKKRVMAFTFGEELRERYLRYNPYVFNCIPMIPRKIIKKKPTGNEVKHILFLGRLSKEKGVDDLLLAFSKVNRKFKGQITLHIAGAGPERRNLEKKAISLDIEQCVQFHGFVSRGRDLWDLYDKSQIFVLPSYTEGMPRALFEAMARGEAPICTRVGGIPNIIDDKKNGVLIRPGDINGLKDAILELQENKFLRHKITKRAYETVQEVTFEKQGDEMVRLINEVLIKDL